jgi:hypothetical protein
MAKATSTKLKNVISGISLVLLNSHSARLDLSDSSVWVPGGEGLLNLNLFRPVERVLLSTTEMATASNHLTIPYKRTTIPPIKEAVREFLENSELDAHPDAFDWDTSQWEHLRAEVSNVNLHVSAIDDFLKYVCSNIPLTRPTLSRFIDN